MADPTATPEVPTPTPTGTPVPPTATPAPTPTATPVPGAIVLSKYVDTLNGLNGVNSFNALSAAHTDIRIRTTNVNTKAIVTGIKVSESRSGAPCYTAEGNSFYTIVDPNIYPVTITSVMAVSGITLSAFGSKSAAGPQTLTYTVTLSSTCLVGSTPTPVTNPVQTLTTVVSAVNTPYNGFTSKAEFTRLWALNG